MAVAVAYTESAYPFEIMSQEMAKAHMYRAHTHLHTAGKFIFTSEEYGVHGGGNSYKHLERIERV